MTLRAWVETVECVRDAPGAVVKRVLKAVHHKNDAPDEFDRVRATGRNALFFDRVAYFKRATPA